MDCAGSTATTFSRRCAMLSRLAEPRLQESAALRDFLPTLANDADATVRLQAAFTLGEIDDPRALDALAAIARRDASDPWIRTAVLSSVATTSDQLLARLVADPNFSGASEIMRDLAEIAGVRAKPAELQRVLAAAEGQPGIFREVLSGIGDGLKRSGRSLRKAGLDGAAGAAAERSLDDAARIGADAQASAEARGEAIQLLAYDEFDRVRAVLASLLKPNQPQEVQRAAVATIATFNRAETAPLLLANWNTGTPAIRADVITAMLGSRTRILPLLEAVERGDIPANQIPFARRAVLLRSSDAKVKELAARLLGESAAGSRNEVIEKYKPALAMKGDAARGRKVFEMTCIVCHRAGDIGTDVGPNLATIRQWNPDQVLINILDPNREVAPNFLNYIVETKDGRTLSGIIAAESPASVTLKAAGGAETSVLRAEISQIIASKASLMPEGLEAAITVEQMADLIAFLLADPAPK